MRVIKRRTLVEFGEKRPQARGPLSHWYELAKAGDWQGPVDVKRVFGVGVDFVGNNRAVFDIKGNNYRLITEINYHAGVIYIRFLGTHAEYDKIDAAAVKLY